MLTEVLRFFAILCVAIIIGKSVSKIKLPAILGWLNHFQKISPFGKTDPRHNVYSIDKHVFVCIANLLRRVFDRKTTRVSDVCVRRHRTRHCARPGTFDRQRI